MTRFIFAFATIVLAFSTSVKSQNCLAAFQAAPDSTGYGYNFFPAFTGNNVYHTWDFGDGTTSTLSHPFHQYNTNGVFLVCLTVEEWAFGAIICSNTRCDSLAVGNPLGGGNCYADFWTSVSGTSATFTDFSWGSPTAWSWDFGDGNTSNSQHPSHTYTSAGTYQVCLSIIDTATACMDTFCDMVTITNGPGPCQAAWFAYPDSGLLGGNSWQFLNQSSGNLTSVLWDFGDGTSSTLNDPQHTFSSNGTFWVCLTISGPNCQDVYCDSIRSTPMGGGCSACFNNSVSGSTVSFTDQSSGSPTAWNWDFGDGNSSTSQNPTHTYATSGTYTVCLNIWDNLGNCQSSWCDFVTISGTGPCQAIFIAYPDSTPLGGNGWQFLNQSTGNFNGSLWDFGDGTTSASQNAFHIYSSPGTYTVCLTVTLAQNGAILCTSTSCDTIVVTTGGGNLGYRLGGMVFTTNNLADAATVYLITLDSLLLTAIDSQSTVQGSYGFMNVPAGSYRVKAALTPNSNVYANFLPTYHASELFWSTADVVNLTTDNNGVNINMVAGNNPGGPGFVGGLVTQGANKTSGVGDPIGGAQVMLLNMNDEPLQYTYSGVNGQFDFQNVAYGTYKVYVERLGIPTDPVIVIVSATNESINDVDIRVNDSHVFSSIENILELTSVPQLHPNPVKEGAVKLSLSLNSPVEISIKLRDVQGRSVMVKTLKGSAGSQQIELDTEHLNAGMYFLEVNVKGQHACALKFIKQ